MGDKMTRSEELKGLETLYQSIASIPEEKRFDYFYENSPTFRKDIADNGYCLSDQNLLCDSVDSETMKLYQNYLALAALRNFASMLYPNYLKRAEYSARDWSYPLDVIIQG